jgi:heat-inducible transcriptional repressor
MPELTDRQKYLMTLIVHDYTKTAQPVASQYLVEHYHLDMSSATVRNEIVALTNLGLLRHRRTTSGCVPTEEGYRFFVSGLLQQTDLPANTRRTISHQFYQSRQQVDEWLRLAASVLAQQSHAASLVTSPRAEQTLFKHLELISIHGRQVLMVLVFMGGQVIQQILTLAEPILQEQLSQAANHLTALCQGSDAGKLKMLQATLSALETDVLQVVIAEMARVESLVAGEVFLDGLTNVLAEPEFAGSEDARRALRLLEERSMLENLLTRTVLNTNIGGVQVLIGGEDTWEELRQCSVVLARYGMPGLSTGMLGVLGPMRMSYGHTISTVRFVAGVLTDLVSDSLLD